MKFINILVPIAGLPIDDEVIRLACQIARRDKAKLLLLHVIEIQRALPLNAESIRGTERAEEILEHAEQVAADCGAEVETDLLQARVAGPALVDAAIERGVDLIAMALPYRSKADHFYLGATTTYVLDHAPCRVWLCRASAPAKAAAADQK